MIPSCLRCSIIIFLYMLTWYLYYIWFTSLRKCQLVVYGLHSWTFVSHTLSIISKHLQILVWLFFNIHLSTNHYKIVQWLIRIHPLSFLVLFEYKHVYGLQSLSNTISVLLEWWFQGSALTIVLSECHLSNSPSVQIQDE